MRPGTNRARGFLFIGGFFELKKQVRAKKDACKDMQGEPEIGPEGFFSSKVGAGPLV